MTPRTVRTVRTHRTTGLLALALVVATLLSGCAQLVDGHPTAGIAPNAKLDVVGGTQGAVDTLVENAISDVTAFWHQQYPSVSGGKALPPLRGGLYSIDAGEVVATGKVAGPAAKEGCVHESATFIVDNAAYCKLDDSIVWDRNPSHVFGVMAQEFGPLMIALAFGHEYGHAIQDRLGIFDNKNLPAIDTESQADCAAGAFLASVVNGKAAHFKATAADLDKALNGYLLVRDVISVSTADISHGDGFDRLSAIDDGLTKGSTYCFASSYFNRKFTERPFTNDQDYLTGGNETLAQVLDPNDPAKDPNAGGLIPDLNRFWSKAASKVGKSWQNVKIAEAAHPACGASSSSEFGYCPSDNTVYYSDALANSAYNSLSVLQVSPHTGNAAVIANQAADFALGTLFSIGWGLAALHQWYGRELTSQAALLSAACYTGAYAQDINNLAPSNTPVFALSPPDMDEATSAMLNLVGLERAYGSRGTTGLQRIQSFVKGYNGGTSSC